MKLILLSLLFPVLAFAHGGEDHSHDEAPGARTAAAGHPRIEAATESFEIVGHLRDGELSLLIDRFETNEPVLDGNVEVELNGRKAIATYHADHGDYAVSDEAFIRTLASPGTHSLVFTISAGDEMDLIEATMAVGDDAGSAAGTNAPPVSLRTAAIAGIVLTLILTAIAIALARRKPSTGN
ncbi:hypothetical protein [Noviherbaspirillum aridicola]|nr:hypothetical protein [Noviherbaspirillum aridicola]